MLFLTFAVPAIIIAANAQEDAACAGCKARLKPSAAFCAECGVKVSGRLCAECKKPLKPGAGFCAECGKKVDTAAPPPTQDPDAVKEKRGDELEKFGVTAEQINRAIERGAAYLASHYKGENKMGGDDYLGAYALIHTSLYHTNTKLREKIIDLLRRDDWLKSGQAVYAAGLRALALEATKDPELKPLAREVAEYLVEAQGPDGSWRYREEVKLTPIPEAPAETSGLSVSGGEPLDEAPKGEMVAKKGTGRGGNGDNSCTQFAVLGLHAAARCGFSVPRETWERCLKETEKRQNKDESWGYHGSSNTGTGSMTCAAICTMTLCRAYLGEKNPAENEKIQAAIQWLAANFSVSTNPKSPQWPLYYLYSVERVGVFCATESIGKHRWYPMGAKHLVDIQRADGAWDVGTGSPEIETSFALLFLTRATAPVRALKRGGKGRLETHALNEAQNFLFILDCSGSMMEEIDGRPKVDVAKEVIEQIVKRLPEGTHVGLRVYGHRFNALQDDAETDSEIVIPIAPLKIETFIAHIKALRCRGKTPITHSLRECVKDLSRVPADVEMTAILLTDGGESTRGAKPADAARALVAARKGMKLHVVGFDINQDNWKEQLEEVAAVSNGRYFHCRKASDLMGALSVTTVGASDYILRDKDAREIGRGKLGDRRELPEGKYLFAIEVEGKREEKTVWINTDVTSHVTVNLARFLKKQP
jgi:hypothetical protein